MQKILAATDGSAGAGRAVDFAAHLAADARAALVIAHVIGGYGLPHEAFTRLSRSQAVGLEEMLRSYSTAILAEARAQTLKFGVAPIEVESRQGDVVDTLLQLAHEHGADVIVAGRRGAGSPAALLLGSVAHKLVGLAPIPVIVTP